jgi:hypothetical protein
MFNGFKALQTGIKVFQLDAGAIYYLVGVTTGTLAGQDIAYGLGSLTTRPDCIGEETQSYRISYGEYLGIRGLIGFVHFYETFGGFNRIGQEIQVRLIADGNDDSIRRKDFACGKFNPLFGYRFGKTRPAKLGADFLCCLSLRTI